MLHVLGCVALHPEITMSTPHVVTSDSVQQYFTVENLHVICVLWASRHCAANFISTAACVYSNWQCGPVVKLSNLHLKNAWTVDTAHQNQGRIIAQNIRTHGNVVGGRQRFLVVLLGLNDSAGQLHSFCKFESELENCLRRCRIL